MKKTSKSRGKSANMAAEYEFDYSKAKPNRFAGRIAKDRLVVILDPEVSKGLNDSESVSAGRQLLDPTSASADGRK